MSEAVVGQELLVVRICWLTIAVGCQKLLVVMSSWMLRAVDFQLLNGYQELLVVKSCL